MPFISVRRLLIVLALIVFAPVWKNSQFVAVSAIPAASAQTVAPTCPQGYTLSGNTCVKGAPKPVCPAGYTLSGNNCVKGPPAPSCPSGFVFSQGQCVAGASSGPWAFVVTLALGVKSALELDGATICVVPGSPSQAATKSYFQTNRLNVSYVTGKTDNAAKTTYDKAGCDVLVVEANAANATIDGLSRPNDHGILPERIGGTVASSPPPIRRAPPPMRQAPRVNLALELQKELKRIGCYTGGIDGDWGRGSRSALQRFSSQAGLRLGSEPSQQAIDEARKTAVGYCQPVRVAPKRPKPKGCRSGTVFLEGQCIPKSQVQSFCGPGFERKGSKCVPMQVGQSDRCVSADYAFCKPRAREYCEGDGSNSCINRETRLCLREEIGCTP